MVFQDTMVEYNVLKKNVDTYKALYDELFMRAKELDVSKELSVSNIRIIDLAEIPKNHIKPKPKRDLMLSVALALALRASIPSFIRARAKSDSISA